MIGGAAAAGRELRAGAELSAEIANTVMADINMTMAKNAGIKSMGGAKIEIIFKDHEGNPTLGADLAKKLILDDKVDGLLGCYHSSVTKTVSAVAEQHGIPMINGTSTSPALTKRGFKWFWRTTPHDVWFTKDLFELLTGLTDGKVKGVAAVPKNDIVNLASACENSEWGSFVSALIEDFSAKYKFNLRKSRLGYQLRCIKDNEDIAQSLGINVRWAKVKTYAIATAFVSLVGSFHACYIKAIEPEDTMSLDISILIALMAMLGGAGSLWGPIIGAGILIPLKSYLKEWLGATAGLAGIDLVIYGLIIMLVSAFEPRGIWGIVEKVRRRKRN